MAHYFYTITYSDDAVKAMISKPTDRKVAAGKMITAAGGTLKDLYFIFGSIQSVCVIEALDDQTMTAIDAIVRSTGAITASTTTKLFTSEEAQEAFALAGKVAGTYVPPHG